MVWTRLRLRQDEAASAETLISQKKPIKFEPLSCLRQIGDTQVTFVFVMTIHFGQMRKLLVWFCGFRGRMANVTYLLAPLLSQRHY